MNAFKTHTGVNVPGPQFMAACKAVADDWRNLAHAIRKEDRYASHVTEARKEQALQDMLENAARIEAGEIESFTIWQRINTKLTGECVGFLPPVKAKG